MTDKNYIYKKLSDGRYIKEIDNKVEHLATAQEDSKLATDIRSLLQGPQGLDGTSGTSGQDGTSGVNGQKGDIGRTGLTGPRGLNGTSGTSGSSGQDGTSGVNGQDGTSGINGRKGDKGDKGDRGFPGLQGPMGAKGEDGVIGSSGTSGINGTFGTSGSSGTSGVNGQNGQSSSYFLYRAKANTYTGNPNDSYILWNNATQTGATAIHINHLTQDNLDVDIFLGLIRQGSNLIIQNQSNSSEYQTWDVNGTPTLVSGANNYWIVPVTLINSTTSFTNNTNIFVAVSADSGTSGSSGTSGINGQSGSSGSSGTSGVNGQSGSSGSSGTSGLSGSSGSSGTSGVSGSSGSSGLDGSSGTSGTSYQLVSFKSTSPGATVSATSSQVVLSAVTIPPNTFTSYDVVDTFVMVTSSLNSNTKTIRGYIGTYSVPVGQPIGSSMSRFGSNGSGTGRTNNLRRRLMIFSADGTGEATHVYPDGALVNTDDTTTSVNAYTRMSIDWTKQQYIYFTNIITAPVTPTESTRTEFYYVVKIA